MGKAHSKLTNEQITELQNGTYFNKKELQKWYKAFVTECPSGVLNRVDFLNIYKQFFPFGDPTTYSDYVFNVIDKKKKGIIEFRQFISALSLASRGNEEEKILWAFHLYDINGDGFITRDEMLRIVESVYKMVGNMVEQPVGEETPEKRVEKIFSIMDQDNDGKISLDEFRAGSYSDETMQEAFCLYQGLV